MTQTSTNILFLLKTVLSGSAREQDVNSLVRCAYQYAYTRLRQLINSRRLHLHSFPLNIEGITFDCIAEIFQRNEDGVFIDLIDYFSDERTLGKLNEAEAQHHFRVLVFRKLQDGIVRLYRENDPVLSKIIRNVKLAIQALPNVYCFERMGQVFIASCPEDQRYDHLPEFPIEQIESELTTRIVIDTNAQDYLLTFLEILNSQEHFRRFYALIDVAVVIKRSLAAERIPLDNLCRIDETLLDYDIERIVTNSIRDVERTLYMRYVSKNKINKDLFKQYAAALKEILIDVFVRNNGLDISQPEYLRRQIADLTTEQYRLIHRTHFEHMVRVAKTMVKEKLKELL